MTSSTAASDVGGLNRITDAADYLAKGSRLMERIRTCSDRWHALEVLFAGTRILGAESAIYVSFLRDDTSGDSYHRLVACDPRWSSEYDQLAWVKDDPWLRYAIAHTEPARGSEIPACTPEERATVELAQRFGFRSSVIVPTPSSAGYLRWGVLYLGSSTPQYFEGDGYSPFKVVARSFAMELHEWWQRRLQEDLIGSTGLTERDLGLLRLIRDGLSTKEIARRMQVTPISVQSRIQRLRGKLGVRRRRSAARVAVEYGLL
jgi:DNA-binding CsgD family transcriptional regulator